MRRINRTVCTCRKPTDGGNDRGLSESSMSHVALADIGGKQSFSIAIKNV